MQAHVININRKIIDLTNNQYNFFIYGGFTEHSIEERKEQHIRDNQPYGCDLNWKIVKVTTYTLLGDLELDKNNISKIENYLINSLDIKFGRNCINSRDTDGLIKQLGGNGLNITNNNIGDKIIFYIFYEQLNQNDIFI
jgi:hypothetical protein